MSRKFSHQDINEGSSHHNAFYLALTCDAQILSHAPNLLWQQMYNRLEGVKTARDTLTKERQNRKENGYLPWLQLRYPIHTLQTLSHTLKGHTVRVHACAISSGRAYVVSTIWIKTLKVWDVVTRADVATLPLPGEPECLTLHPLGPFVACGDNKGGFYKMDLLGFRYGPIILTTALKKHWLTKEYLIRCLACQQDNPVRKEKLSSDMTCPTPGCGLQLKINPFIIDPS